MSFHPDPAKIKRWREERHWSQEHLAALAGVGTRTIQRIENGGKASHESIMALAAAFNVDAAALTIDPASAASEAATNKLTEGLRALRLSFFIHFASYILGMIVFLAIGATTGDGATMMVPAIWWTVGLSGHALPVIILSLVAHFQP